jgi:hypothetical protein
MRRSSLFSLLCAFSLAGCAEHWHRAGASGEDFYRDNSSCLALSNGGSAQVAQASGPVLQGYNAGAAMAAASQADAIYQQCMLGHGWRHGRY